MAITHILDAVGEATGTSSATTSFSTEIDDIIWVTIGSKGSGIVGTPTRAGDTFVSVSSIGGFDQNIQTYYARCTSATTNPVDVTTSSSSRHVVTVAVYRGVLATGSPLTPGGSAAAASGSVINRTKTAVTSGEVVLNGFVMVTAGSPGGILQQSGNIRSIHSALGGGTDTTVYTADRFDSTGSVDMNWTTESSDEYAVYIESIRPEPTGETVSFTTSTETLATQAFAIITPKVIAFTTTTTSITEYSFTSLEISLAVTGSATNSINADDIVAGSKVIVLNITNDTLVSGTSFDDLRQDILYGLDGT